MKGINDGMVLSEHEQLELIQQNLTLCLQQIDQNFAKCHSIITRKILPHVERYGHVSQAASNNSKFWKQFFEASANVSLSGYCDDEDEEGVEQQEEEDLEESTSAASTPRDKGQRDASLMSSASTASPYQRLRNEIRTDLASDDGLDDASSNAPSSNASRSRYTRAQGSMIPMPSSRYDDQDGSPGSLVASPDMPLAKLSLNEIRQGISSPRYQKTIASPIKGAAQGQGGAKSKLVNKVLDKNATRAQGSPAKTLNVRTPKAAAKTQWTDLSKVPLNHSFGDPNAFASPDSPASDTDLPPGMSPPVTMQFSVPASKLLKTPARQAANMMVQDLLRTAGAGGHSHLGGPSPTGPTPPSLRRHTMLFDAYGTLNEASQSSSLNLSLQAKGPSDSRQQPAKNGLKSATNMANAELDERQKAAIFDRQEDDDDDDDDDEDEHRHEVEDEMASTNGLDQSIDDLIGLVQPSAAPAVAPAPAPAPTSKYRPNPALGARKSLAAVVKPEDKKRQTNRRMTEDTLFGLHDRKSLGSKRLSMKGMNKDNWETMHGGRLDAEATGLVDSPLMKKAVGFS